MRRTIAAVVLLVAVARVSAAPGERTHDIVPADYASVNTITEIALSPDGKKVAYCLAIWDKKTDRRATDLWIVDTDGKGKPKQLTSDRANDSHPKWSADGKAVFVLAKRGEKAKPQVWRVPLDGGKPEAFTDAKDGVIAYDHAPKADTIFYSVDASVTDDGDFLELRKKFDKIEYGHGTRTVSEVYSVKGPKLDAEKVLADKRYIREFAVTQDGKRIAMVSAFDDSVVKSEGESRVDVWENGKITTPPTDVYRKKAASPYAWLEGLAWNAEGTRYAFCCIHDAYPAEVIIGWAPVGERGWMTTKLARPKHEGVNETHVRGYGSPLKWAGDTSLACLVEREGQVTLSYSEPLDQLSYDLDGQLGVGSVVYAFDMVGKQRVILAGDSLMFPELWVRNPKGDGITTLTNINPHTKDWKLPSIKHTTWKSPDGANVGGPLELPHGWKKGDKPLPLVVAIHGGPTTASYNDQRFDPHNGRLYFAAKGYAVLCPNYRGSTGYGDKFLTDLIGNENDLDVKDIVAGIQHLIKEGIADSERVAVMGWSNGGYLTNCLITMKDPAVKIKAASSGAGILDTVAEWGFNDEPAYPIVFKKGLPWEQSETYKKTSPIYGIGNVTTPTLIHVGGNDVRCPPGHSQSLYRALKEYKNVPTQLNVYPGQPHGLGTLSFRTAKMEWDLAWFEKYLAKK